MLELPPGTPSWLSAGADAALVVHISGGAVGLVAGACALAARKGARLHRMAGTVFFIAMLAMAGTGALIAPFLPRGQWTNTTAGLFTFYLVATAWAAARRPDGRTGLFEIAAFLMAAGLAAMGATLAVLYAGTPDAEGFEVVWGFAAVAAFAGALDLRMMLAGGVTGPARIRRHLWRMTLALTVAAVSFFVGQQKVMPEVVRGHPLLFAPPLLALLLMVFWLVRTRSRSQKPAAAAA